MSKRRRKKKAAARPILRRAALATVAVAVLAVLFFWRPLQPHRSAPPVRTPHAAATLPEPAATATAAALATALPVARRRIAAAPAASNVTGDEAQRDPDAAPVRLALVIDDCGQHLEQERRFTTLGVPVTLSILPHVRDAAAIARAAAAANSGIMLHLPMENRAGIDPGPGAITTGMDDAAISSGVRDDLDAVPLATGVNNHEGSRATADARVMRDVAGVLAARHRFFLDSRTTAATVAEREARAAGVPATRRDVFLDDVDDRAAIEAQLREAAAIARRRGSAIAIGHPRAATYDAIAALAPELEAAGVTFVRVSELIR